MLNIIGTWVPYAYEARYLETPKHPMKKNGFSTLHIRPDGTGVASRKGLLGAKNLPISWHVFDEMSSSYQIFIGDSMVLLGFVEGDVLEVRVETRTYTPGVTDMGVYFKKSSSRHS